MDKVRSKFWFKAILFAVIGLAFMIPQYTQYQMSPLAGQIMERYHLSVEQFSSIFTAGMVPAIFLNLIAGSLSDKYGGKKIITVLFVVSVLGAVSRIFATGFVTMWVSMAACCCVALGFNVNAIKIAASIVGVERSVALAGVFWALSSCSLTVATATSAYFPSIASAFCFSAVIMVVVAVLFTLMYKDAAPKSSLQEADAERVPISESLKVCLSTKEVWISAIIMFLQLGGYVGLTTFLPTQLADNGLSAISAGWVASALTFGNVIGCLAAPVAAGKLGRSKPLMLAVALVSALGTAFAWRIENAALVTVAYLVTGIAMGCYTPLMQSVPLNIEKIGTKYLATANGLICTLQLLGAVVLSSYILVPITGDNFGLLFTLIGVCYAITFVLVLGLKEPMRGSAK